MKKTSLSLLLFMIVFINQATTQSLKIKTVTAIRPQVQQLIHSYFQHFDGVKGDTLSQSNGSIIYSSKILPPGAIESSITQYGNGNSYSWQATLLRTEDFNKAVELYKKYYQQFGMPVVLDDKSTSKLAGQFDIPEEARSFASSILQLQKVSKELRLLKVEIAINYTFPEWTVKLLTYEKQADEDMRPTNPGDEGNN